MFLSKKFQFLLVVIYCCCCSKLSCKSLSSASANALGQPNQRKPFITPQEPEFMKNFIRIKREIAPKANEFQNMLQMTKEQCIKDMGFPKEMLEKSLMNSTNFTLKQKCLLECIFKRTKIMDPTNNKLSVQQIGRIAEKVSNSNPLVVSIAMASAENCNRKITAKEPCEAAYQINQAISNEMRAHKINIKY